MYSNRIWRLNHQKSQRKFYSNLSDTKTVVRTPVDKLFFLRTHTFFARIYYTKECFGLLELARDVSIMLSERGLDNNGKDKNKRRNCRYDS